MLNILVLVLLPFFIIDHIETNVETATGLTIAAREHLELASRRRPHKSTTGCCGGITTILIAIILFLLIVIILLA